MNCLHNPVPVFVERKSDAALILLEWICSKCQCPLQDSQITSVEVPARVTVVPDAGTALHAFAAV
jgi:hypothetical protein